MARALAWRVAAVAGMAVMLLVGTLAGDMIHALFNPIIDATTTP
jgi:hypothetical protein